MEARGEKNVLGLLQEIPALSEELLPFGAAVRSPGCSLGGFSLKMHFLLTGPGFSLQNPPDPSSFPAFPGSVACGAGPGPSCPALQTAVSSLHTQGSFCNNLESAGGEVSIRLSPMQWISCTPLSHTLLLHWLPPDPFSMWPLHIDVVSV